VCLWCVGQAALRKTASLHALKHALYTDDLLMKLSCSDKLHSMEAVSELQRIFSHRTGLLAFYSTCCPSAPRHGCCLFCFWLIDCLRQLGKKQKPQPLFMRACDHRPYPTALPDRPYRSYLLAGGRWYPQRPAEILPRPKDRGARLVRLEKPEKTRRIGLVRPSALCQRPAPIKFSGSLGSFFERTKPENGYP